MLVLGGLRSQINHNLEKHFGKRIRLAEISPETIFEFQQVRLKQGAGKATINRDVATLSSCLSREEDEIHRAQSMHGYRKAERETRSSSGQTAHLRRGRANQA